MKYLLFSLLSFALLCSIAGCFILNRQFKDTEGYNDLKSKYNADNHIYSTNRAFQFESVIVSGSDTVAKEYLTLKILPGHWFKQTKMKWSYRKSILDSIAYNSEITGLIETRDKVWFHPPRQGLYSITESMPFPTAHIHQSRSPRTYSGSFFIGSGWPEELKGTYDIYSTYIGDTIFSTGLGQLRTTQTKWEYIQKNDTTKHSQAIIHFNNEYGIVHMHGFGLEGDELLLTLQNYKP